MKSNKKELLDEEEEWEDDKEVQDNVLEEVQENLVKEEKENEIKELEEEKY